MKTETNYSQDEEGVEISMTRVEKWCHTWRKWLLGNSIPLYIKGRMFDSAQPLTEKVTVAGKCCETCDKSHRHYGCLHINLCRYSKTHLAALPGDFYEPRNPITYTVVKED